MDHLHYCDQKTYKMDESVPTSPFPAASKQALIQDVQQGWLTTDWKVWSAKYQQPENKLRAIYNKLVSPVNHVQACLRYLNKDDIAALVESDGFVCTECNLQFHHPKIKIWQSSAYCDECHEKNFQTQIEERWNQLNDHLRATGKAACAICRKPSIYSRDHGYRFHLNPVNMFSKCHSIYGLVLDGSDMSVITQEIDQCQILCNSCHGLVTKIERKSGLTRLKQARTRGRVQQTEQLNIQVMEPVYDALRDALSSDNRSKRQKLGT